MEENQGLRTVGNPDLILGREQERQQKATELGLDPANASWLEIVAVENGTNIPKDINTGNHAIDPESDK